MLIKPRVTYRNFTIYKPIMITCQETTLHMLLTFNSKMEKMTLMTRTKMNHLKIWIMMTS